MGRIGRRPIEGIPPHVLDEAAQPAVERILALVPRVPRLYEGLLKDMAERLLDPDLKMRELWERRRLKASSYTGILTLALGTTPWSFIRNLRIGVAARLLADKRIAGVAGATIAFEAGFQSYSALNVAIKDRFGMTPREYRKACLAGSPPEPLARCVERPDEVTEAREAPADAEDADTPEKILNTLDRVDRLTVRGELDLAAAELEQAAVRVAEQGHSLALAVQLDARRGFVSHRRAELLVRDLDVDGAFAELEEARIAYDAAGELPPVLRRARKHVPLADDVRTALIQELCGRCGPELQCETGRTVREHLRRALEPVPRDLEWFRFCCDECYRAVWGAIEKARLGLIDDAWKAAWLVAHADPVDEVPSSLARYVRALHESEVLTHEEQLPRLELCRLAAATARALGDPLREAYALCFVANALRVLGGFNEGRRALRDASKHCHARPWSAALLAEAEGRLAVKEMNHQLAMEKLSSAMAIYQHLDLHLVGYVLIAQGERFFNKGEYEAAVRVFEDAANALDRRRAPVLVSGAIPLNCAAALGAIGRQMEAWTALGRCKFDRIRHRRMAATELLVSGCLALAEERREEALVFFSQAANIFEALDRLREKAFATSYSVEAYAGLGQHAQAIESAAEALRLFQALGCKEDTVEAFALLGQQLEAAAIDTVKVASIVRGLVRQQGGWLPDRELGKERGE